MQYHFRLITKRTTNVQLRGVPVNLRDRLRRRAARKGVSMSRYVIEILEDDLARPTLSAWLAEVGKLPPVDLGGETGADLVRAARREMGLED
jgi:hypothetical protein